jgi:hypothetical protein
MMCRRPRSILQCALLFAFSSLAALCSADEITLQGDSVTTDTTLLSEVPTFNTGAAISNRAGRSGMAALRRYLVQFDISSVPDGVMITSATLTLRIQNAPNSTPTNQSLHRVTAGWVEGTSTNQNGEFVAGAASWNSASEGILAWQTPGGDFMATPSATQTVPGVGAIGSEVSWSGAALAADVQVWLDGTEPNFGWILIGEESANQTARNYHSAEAAANQPKLTIEFAPLSRSPHWRKYD